MIMISNLVTSRPMAARLHVGFGSDNHQLLTKKADTNFISCNFFPPFPFYFPYQKKKRMFGSLLSNHHAVQVLCRAALNHVFCKIKSLTTTSSVMESGKLFASPQRLLGNWGHATATIMMHPVLA
ncbi:hypothetical protein PSHT_12932 [Puccinia striiformis]|uniref:Uncharacterized protein n=2 Tax=Puccinia striiformis TaxID=27350 RepID=A0A2S4UTM8_9BASI|nr:hypothetical protein PSHT_12932 [Puccinia striiformis]